MRLLPAAAVVSAGRVELGDDELLRLPEHRMRQVRGRRIGMVFQDPATALNPVMRVGAQIVEAIEAHTPLRGAAARAEAVAWLSRVGIPDPARRIDDHPHRFSGGQKQRVAIAIALAGEPALLVADEPTSALDSTVQSQILDLLRTLQRERGLALLLITHDLRVVSAMAHRVALMYAGQIVELASARDFFAAPRHPYARLLLQALPDLDAPRASLASIPGEVPALSDRPAGCRFAPRCDRVFALCTAIEPRLVASGRSEVRCLLYDGEVAAPAAAWQAAAVQRPTVRVADAPAAHLPLLEVRDLRVTYRRPGGFLRRPAVHGVLAVDGVSFSVRAGETLALIGESGCGKTTAGKAIVQLLRGDAQIGGSVCFGGVDLCRLGGVALRQARRDVQFVFQDPASSLDPRLRVGAAIDDTMRALRPAWGADERRTRLLALMAQVGMPADALDRHPHALSGGQRQRVAIARALAVEPRLIVCDEPTSALDMSVQAQVLNLLQRLQRELGLAYLFITHDLSVVRQMAHAVAVMGSGRIDTIGSVDAVLSPPRTALTERLWRAVPRTVGNADHSSSGVLSDT